MAAAGARRMLIALAQRPQGLTKQQLGVRAGLAHSSGTFGTYLGKLRSESWVRNDGGALVITEHGQQALGEYEPLPTGRALYDHWMSQLPDGAARMLTTLYTQYPDELSAEALGQASQISHTSGTFGTYLGRLRSLELVEGPRDRLKASGEFFE